MPPPEAAEAWPSLDDPTELVQRLRCLRWPEPSPQARARCWARLAAQLQAAFGGGQARSA
jgi:hypothetical protein